jgi:hypothetical protein
MAPAGMSVPAGSQARQWLVACLFRIPPTGRQSPGAGSRPEGTFRIWARAAAVRGDLATELSTAQSEFSDVHYHHDKYPEDGHDQQSE